MCELCHQNKFVFVYFKSFGDCVDKQLPFRTQGDLKLVVMACNILRYFKLYCIMFCKVCKKLKWSFLTFFDISIHAEWDNYNNFNKVLVNHDLIRFTQYIHVHYTSLRESRPYNFFHLNLHQGLLQTFLTSLNVELLYFCVFVRKTICNTYSIIF